MRLNSSLFRTLNTPRCFSDARSLLNFMAPSPLANTNTSGTQTTPKLIDRRVCVEIARSTLKCIEEGSYEASGVTYTIRDAVAATNAATRYYPPDSDLSHWAQDEKRPQAVAPVAITVLEGSTLQGARQLSSAVDAKVGVLNFASAKSPGGGFLGGSRAQEESIARSSTLYPSLTSSAAQPFYALHNAHSHHGLYSHAMIYSPGVLLLRADAGDWLPPLTVDIVTAPAVNAGAYRNYLRKNNIPDETEIDDTMRERMARILYLFEVQGVRNPVLGSFGTGAFKNRVELVIGAWKELLVDEGARFRLSFDRVMFAVVDAETYQKFEAAFAVRPANDSEPSSLQTHSLTPVPSAVREESK